MSLVGLGVEASTIVNIYADWPVAKSVVSGVDESPGWEVLGEYPLAKSCTAYLDVIHLVSAAGLTSRVRLWDATLGVPVSGQVSTTSEAPQRTSGGKVQLQGGRSYQIQAECVGASGADQFSVVESVSVKGLI